MTMLRRRLLGNVSLFFEGSRSFHHPRHPSSGANITQSPSSSGVHQRPPSSTAGAVANNKKKALYQLPSIIDATGFLQMVRHFTHQLIDEKLMASLTPVEKSAASASRNSSRPSHQSMEVRSVEKKRRNIQEQYRELFSLDVVDVEALMRKSYGITGERHATPLVPYQAQVDILRTFLPRREAQLMQQEMDIEDHVRLQNADVRKRRREKDTTLTKEQNVIRAVPVNTIAQWYEADQFVQKKPMDAGTHWRMPIVCIMGHIDHGKTTLLDTLQGSKLVQSEAGQITQVVRAFSIKCDDILPEARRRRQLQQQQDSSEVHQYPATMTFLDTPGHKVFSEMRLHGQFATDIVLLLIALDEGVKRQTIEVAKVAMECNRPVVVLFNKMDLYADHQTLEAAVERCNKRLREIGLIVKDIPSKASLDKMCATKLSTKRAETLMKQGVMTMCANHVAQQRGSSSPVELTTMDECFFSKAVEGEEDIRTQMQREEQQRQANSDALSAATGQHQQQPKKEQMPRSLEEIKLKRKCLGITISAKTGANVDLMLDVIKAACRLHPLHCDAGRNKCQATVLESWKKSSDGAGRDVLTNITTIVRSGELRVGMPFVADSCYGTVLALEDYWGKSIRSAMPGIAATVVCSEPSASCPGSGTHIIEVSSASIAATIGNYRRLLQIFVENYHKKLHLLRPKGLDTKFLHVGNFGQVEVDLKDSIEATVLYGREASLNTGETETVNDAEWSAMQLEKQPSTLEEYSDYMKNCETHPVVLKVSTWHTGRLLTRELQNIGTRSIRFEVMGVRFGELTKKELEQYSMQVRLFVCFRTPRITDGQLASKIEKEQITVVETDVYTELVAFLKNYAVAMQRKFDDKNQTSARALDSLGAGGVGGGKRSSAETSRLLEQQGFSLRMKGGKTKTGLRDDAKIVMKRPKRFASGLERADAKYERDEDDYPDEENRGKWL